MYNLILECFHGDTCPNILNFFQALSLPTSTSLPFGSIYPSQVTSVSNSPLGRPTNGKTFLLMLINFQLFVYH